MNSNSKCNACSDEEVFLGGIGQRPERRRALLVGDRLQFRRHVVPVRHVVCIRIDHAGAPIRIIVADHDSARALLNIEQTVRIIEGVEDLGLPRYRHRRASARIVVGVVHPVILLDLTLVSSFATAPPHRACAWWESR